MTQKQSRIIRRQAAHERLGSELLLEGEGSEYELMKYGTGTKNGPARDAIRTSAAGSDPRLVKLLVKRCWEESLDRIIFVILHYS